MSDTTFDIFEFTGGEKSQTKSVTNDLLSTHVTADDLNKIADALNNIITVINDGNIGGGTGCKIESISVNNTNINPDMNKNINIIVPTGLTDLAERSYLSLTDLPTINGKTISGNIINDEINNIIKDYIDDNPSGPSTPSITECKIESISLNSKNIPPVDKNVNIEINSVISAETAVSALTADKLISATTIELAGSVVGSAVFDGSTNIIIDTSFGKEINIEVPDDYTMAWDKIFHKPTIDGLNIENNTNLVVPLLDTALANKIESISVNGVLQTPDDNKKVDIDIPITGISVNDVLQTPVDKKVNITIDIPDIDIPDINIPITGISVNDVLQTPVDKKVNIDIPITGISVNDTKVLPENGVVNIDTTANIQRVTYWDYIS